TVDGVIGVTTNNGAINLTAGGANNLLTVSNAITSGGANITLTADDMALNATVNAGAGNVTLVPTTANRPVDLGTNTAGTLGLTSAEVTRVTANRLTVSATGTGAITVSAAIAPSGTSNLTLISGGAVSGAGMITVTNLRISSTGAITLAGNNDVGTFAAAVTGPGSGIIFADINSMIVGIVDGVTGITTNNGSITLAADDLDVQQTINAGTNRVTLETFTANRPIDLGTNTAGQLGLTDAELDRITASVLQVGFAASGPITVSAAISPANANTLTLRTSGGV